MKFHCDRCGADYEKSVSVHWPLPPGGAQHVRSCAGCQASGGFTPAVDELETPALLVRTGWEVAVTRVTAGELVKLVVKAKRGGDGCWFELATEFEQWQQARVEEGTLRNLSQWALDEMVVADAAGAA